MTQHPLAARPAPWLLLALAVWALVTLALWLLAFAPLPVEEQWLSSARAICFGSTEDGLPSAEGWLTLIGGPLTMLAFIAVLFGRELRSSWRWMVARPVGRWLVVAMAAGVAIGLAGVADRVRAAQPVVDLGPQSTLPEHYPRLDRAVPSFRLIDQTGNELSEGDLVGRPTLLTFAFAHCQTICPVIVDRALEAADLSAGETRLVVVTLDPWRDTPSSLPRVAAGWGLAERSGTHVLSGEPDRVVEVLKAFDVPFERDLQTGDVSHPALLYVLDPDGRIAFALNNPSVGWIEDALERLSPRPTASAPANPLETTS